MASLSGRQAPGPAASWAPGARGYNESTPPRGLIRRTALNVLFVCSRNRLRSPTAEAVFHGVGGLSCASAGTASDAEEVLTRDHLSWADVVVAMEARHRKIIGSKFGRETRGAKILTLGIPDNFEFMDPELVELLWARAAPLLGVERPAPEPAKRAPAP